MSLLDTVLGRTKPAPAAKPGPKRDGLREALETVVFVVTLVLMLKLFIVEAFVIPTGSMAETLYGYQKSVTCPYCKYDYVVNSSEEVEPRGGQVALLVGACCPNCQQPTTWPLLKTDAEPRRGVWPLAAAPGNNSGDRVLVSKALYGLTSPQRGDVVVFKFPVDPQVDHTAQNYIKRLWGLGGETLAIHRGDLYLCRTLEYPADDPRFPRPPEGQEDRIWEGPMAGSHSATRPPYVAANVDYTYSNADKALEKFRASREAGFPAGVGGFELVRKSDEVALAMRRIVYDNEHQSEFTSKKGVPPRWGGDGWAGDSPATPKAFTHAGGDLNWLRYAHRVPGPITDALAPDGTPMLTPDGRVARSSDFDKLESAGGPAGLFPPQPITNFLGYNSGETLDPAELRKPPELRKPILRPNGQYWVGDLMLECEAKISGPDDEVVLELGKGLSRYQARLKGGQATLVRVGPLPPGAKPDGVVAAAATRITKGGKYSLRFADFDARLRLTIDGRAIDFGSAADLPPWDATGFGDALPALVGGFAAPAPDGLTVQNDIAAPASVGASGNVEVRKLKLWQDTYFTPAGNSTKPAADAGDPVDTFYVHPGHYLCLGDNSGQSSDSRKWGLVPDRLMLGKAQMIFWPRTRIGFIK